MKTTILTIVMLLLSVMITKGQLKIEDPHGYINHASAGVFIGAASKVITYRFLVKRTNLSMKQCKRLSWFLSAASGFFAGHVLESWQMKNGGFYSKNDMIFAGGGALFSSTVASLIMNYKGSVPICRYNEVKFMSNIDNLNFKLETMKNSIRVERAKKRITQGDLAKKVNVSRQTIHAIECEKFSPGLTTGMKIAKFFKIPVEKIFELDE